MVEGGREMGGGEGGDCVYPVRGIEKGVENIGFGGPYACRKDCRQRNDVYVT